MHHARTPELVKNRVSKDMSKRGDCSRVLIAFGLGVNCKQASRIIHFGPFKNIRCYIQGDGRAGRDGCPSNCISLYNGLLSTYCTQDMNGLTFFVVTVRVEEHCS